MFQCFKGLPGTLRIQLFEFLYGYACVQAMCCMIIQIQWHISTPLVATSVHYCCIAVLLINDHYKCKCNVQCFCEFGCNLNCTTVWWSQKYHADDVSITFSLFFRRRTVCEGEGRGELVVWLVKVAWIRACLKAGLSDHLDQQNASQKKKKRKDQLWNLRVECTYGLRQR